MSVTATWSEGVFKPTGEVKGAVPGKAYRVFSDEELLELTEGIQWLSRAAKIKLRRSRFSVITNVHCSSRFEAPTA